MMNKKVDIRKQLYNNFPREIRWGRVKENTTRLSAPIRK